MSKEEYIIERLSEITGMSLEVVKLMAYATIAIVGVGALVVMKSYNIF